MKEQENNGTIAVEQTENVNVNEENQMASNGQEEETIQQNEVSLRFVNKSNDMNNASVVVFAKNMATIFEETVIAWQVIENCGRDWSYSFKYPLQESVAAKDSYGNVSDMKNAFMGQKWEVVRAASGDILQLSSNPATNPVEIEIKNSLPQGSIDGQIYKDGKLFASKSGISPRQKAVFQFEPSIWIGVVSQVTEGSVINSAILNDINTKFSLYGLSKADIIMTGGGVGPNATPFVFHLVPTE